MACTTPNGMIRCSRVGLLIAIVFLDLLHVNIGVHIVEVNSKTETFILPCTINNITESITIVWKKGHVSTPVAVEGKVMNQFTRYTLQNTTTGENLTITFATKADAGLYECYAIDQMTKVQSTLFKVLYGKRKIRPHFQPTNMLVVADVGNNAVLPCKIKTKYTSKHKILWMNKLGEVLSFGKKSLRKRFKIRCTEENCKSDWSLYIQNIEDEDMGLYTCMLDSNPPLSINVVLQKKHQGGVSTDKTGNMILLFVAGLFLLFTLVVLSSGCSLYYMIRNATTRIVQKELRSEHTRSRNRERRLQSETNVYIGGARDPSDIQAPATEIGSTEPAPANTQQPSAMPMTGSPYCDPWTSSIDVAPAAGDTTRSPYCDPWSSGININTAASETRVQRTLINDGSVNPPDPRPTDELGAVYQTILGDDVMDPPDPRPTEAELGSVYQTIHGDDGTMDPPDPRPTEAGQEPGCQILVNDYGMHIPDPSTTEAEQPPECQYSVVIREGRNTGISGDGFPDRVPSTSLSEASEEGVGESAELMTCQTDCRMLNKPPEEGQYITLKSEELMLENTQKVSDEQSDLCSALCRNSFESNDDDAAYYPESMTWRDDNIYILH